jgi:hypothetical protein
VLLGKGDGTFAASMDYAAGLHATTIVLGDFNEDKKTDLALATRGNPGKKVDGAVEILLGHGDGTFAAAQAFAANPVNDWVRTADLDGDGHLDLVVTGYDALPETMGYVLMLPGQGDGTFGAPRTLYSSSSIEAVTLDDFNGDGKIDVATILQGLNQVAVLLGHGDGTFAGAVTYSVVSAQFPAALPSEITSIDIDKDGDADLVTTNHNNGTLSALLNNGNGVFGNAVISRVSAPNVDLDLGAYADFDGDGKIDFLGSCFFGYYRVMAGLGNGGFDPDLIERSRGGAAGWVEAADVNGDHRSDAIIADSGVFYVLLNERP